MGDDIMYAGLRSARAEARGSGNYRGRWSESSCQAGRLCLHGDLAIGKGLEEHSAIRLGVHAGVEDDYDARVGA